MKLRLLHKPIPLNAPRQPGEKVYTNLELTRLRITAINFQRIVIASLALFLLGTGFILYAAIQTDHNRMHDSCISSNHSRAEIKQAFSDLYDGFIVASGPSADSRARQFKADRMKQLEKGLPQRSC